MPTSVDIVVVNFNTEYALRQCLGSIRRGATPELAPHTVVVDNASSDGSVEMVREEFPEVELLALDENIGFGAANNAGLREGDADYVLLINSDAELREGALASLVEFLDAHGQCVIAGPQLENTDGSFHPSCRNFPSPLRNAWSLSGMEARFPESFRGLRNWLSQAEHSSDAKVDMVSGACFLARREYLKSVDFFDENLFLYEEEADISLPTRARAADIRYCPEARVVHHGGQSIETSALEGFAARQAYRSKYYCFRKHYGPFRARLTYWSDLGIYGLSAILNFLRRTDSPARASIAACRRAWRESFIPIVELKKSADFFDT